MWAFTYIYAQGFIILEPWQSPPKCPHISPAFQDPLLPGPFALHTEQSCNLLLTLPLQSEQLEEISKPKASLTPACFTMLGQTILLIKVHRLCCLSNHIRCHLLLKLWRWPNLLSCLILWRNLNLYFLRTQALCTYHSLLSPTIPPAGFSQVCWSARE